MKRKPILGETLFELNVRNAARYRDQKLTPVTVTSVGRKYFKCSPHGGYRETSYHIESWHQKTEYSRDCQLYETEQEWADEKETNQIHSELRAEFNHYGRCSIPLETLRAIKSLLATTDQITPKP